LGICIGLQVFYSGTEEGGWYECLDIIPGKVKKLPVGLKVPIWVGIRSNKNKIIRSLPEYLMMPIFILCIVTTEPQKIRV